MKYFLLLLLFTSFNITAQDLEQCGLDDNPVLTEVEAKVVNGLYKDEIGTFNFTDKKILIVTGPTGNNIKSKSSYFKNIERRISLGYEGMDNSGVSILTEEEKIRSNGCDAIIFYGVKWFSKSRKKSLIRKMHRKSITELVNKNSA